jgi:hypothetical protein
VDVPTWSAKAVGQFAATRFGHRFSPRSCVRYLHRRGFVCQPPNRHLLKADGAKRHAFVEQYRIILAGAAMRGARIFFVDEAHFRTDGNLRRLWMLRGRPALVNSTSPKWGEKASFYLAVCLETDVVFGGEPHHSSCAATSAQFPEVTHKNGYRDRGSCLINPVTEQEGQHDSRKRAGIRGGAPVAIPRREQAGARPIVDRVLPDHGLPPQDGGAAPGP